MDKGATGASITIGLVLHRLIAMGYLKENIMGTTYMLTPKALKEMDKPERAQAIIDFNKE